MDPILPPALSKLWRAAVLCGAALVVTAPAAAQDKKDDVCIPGKPCPAAKPAAAAAAPVKRAAKAKGKKPEGPHAITPGFRMLQSGASRAYVLLNQNVTPQIIKTPGVITVVLPGFHVPVNNSKHALHTEYFNTPISDVRLLQGKDDVRLVVTMRANAAPKVQMVEVEAGKSWELRVDFPAGSYSVESHEELQPAPAADHHHKSGHHHHDQAADADKPKPAPHHGQKPKKGQGNGAMGPPTP
jgi:hypothetical protein